jgi:hypothetical protein
MIKRFYLPILFVFGLFMAGCKLDPPDMSGFTSSTNGYQPITKGSTWTYKQSYNTGRTWNETIVMTGLHTTINGKTYYSATDQADTTNSTTYFYQGNGEYHIRSAILGGGTYVEYLYLKDNTAIGESWTAPITDDGKQAGLPVQIVGSVIKKDTTMTISSFTFKNVTHTQLQLQYDIGVGIGFQTYQLIDFYVAKGVGIVEIDTNAGPPINQKSNEPIISYSIKN